MEMCYPNVKTFIKLKLNEIKTFTDITGNWVVCIQMCECNLNKQNLEIHIKIKRNQIST
jgi:ribosome-associated translation inhibitor RaiA